MRSPLLSICIATYNRADFIGETLDSIIPQLTNEVELLVVDGASTDNTEIVMNNYLKKCERIRYIRLPVKGGVDQDYNKAVELALGDMCWLFTDDDLMKPGAISAVIAALKDGHDLIVVNAEVCNRALSASLQNKRLAIHDNKIYARHEMENLFIDALDYLTFIGAVVIRRKVWLSRDRELYFGTEFIHVGVIFQKPLTETALIIAEPYITIRFDNAQWESRRFYIWMFKWPKLVWSFKDISSGVMEKVTLEEPWRKFRVLIVKRSDGEYNAKVYYQYLSKQRANVFWKICAFLISILPREVFIGMRNLYSFVKRIYLSYSKS
jgi:glycosyltransferase involved in cell wall biosynthesis